MCISIIIITVSIVLLLSLLLAVLVCCVCLASFVLSLARGGLVLVDVRRGRLHCNII